MSCVESHHRFVAGLMLKLGVNWTLKHLPTNSMLALGVNRALVINTKVYCNFSTVHSEARSFSNSSDH